MTEDRAIHEPNLHLPSPEYLPNASKDIAKIYVGELKQDEWGIDGIVRQPVSPTKEMLIRRDNEWKAVAKKYPYLEIQIMGLRSVLRNARNIKNEFSQEKLSRVKDFLTHDISFKDNSTENFLMDIFLRRIMVDQYPKLTYDSSEFLQKEAESVRQELNLKEGKSDLRLQDAVRAALTGALSLTRQTTAPMRMS